METGRRPMRGPSLTDMALVTDHDVGDGDKSRWKRRLRASLAATTSWQCTCGAAQSAADRRHARHDPACRYALHLLAAGRGGEVTLHRRGRAFYRQLRWLQLARRRKP